MSGLGKSRYKPCAVLFSLLISVVSGGCADAVLLRPTRQLLGFGTAKEQKVSVDKREIQVLIQRSPACRDGAPQAYVLGFTGNNGRAEEMIGWMASERWADFPVEIWMVNYPGFGQSTGPATLDAIVPSALAVYDALDRLADGRPIFMDGNSFGAAVALSVASVRQTPGMVLKNVPPLRQVVLERYGWWNLYLVAAPLAWQVPRDLDAKAMAARVSVPAVFLMAESDSLVPPHFQGYVHDAYAGPKTIIRMPHAEHIDRADAAAERTLHGWIEQQWAQSVPVATASK